MSKTALVILNYNNAEDTINCIESVERHNTAPVKIIVVDNGSTKARVAVKLDSYMRSRFRDRYTRIKEGAEITWPYLNYATLLISKRNDGYARGNNKGLLLADADPEIDEIMILNNDILFIEDIIPELLRRKAQLPDCAVISPTLLTRDRKTYDINCARLSVKTSVMTWNNFLHYFHRLGGKDYTDYMRWRYLLLDSRNDNADIFPIELPSGSCMLINKQVFKSVDWFDPNTFLYYEEDILHKKFAAIGKRSYLVRNLQCVHLGAASTARVKNALINRAALESQMYYVDRYSGSRKLTKAIFKLSARFYWGTLCAQKWTFKMLHITGR